MSKIDKELTQLNSQKPKEPIEKWTKKKWVDIFQRRHTYAQQVHEKVLIITNHQGNANQATVRYHFTSIGMSIIKKTRHSKCWWGWGAKGLYGRPSISKQITMWSSKPSIDYISKGNEITISKTYLYSRVHCSIIHSCQSKETTSMSTMDEEIKKLPCICVQWNAI